MFRQPSKFDNHPDRKDLPGQENFKQLRALIESKLTKPKQDQPEADLSPRPGK